MTDAAWHFCSLLKCWNNHENCANGAGWKLGIGYPQELDGSISNIPTKSNKCENPCLGQSFWHKSVTLFFSRGKGTNIYILQITPFLTTHGAHLRLKCHQTCRPDENTNRLSPVWFHRHPLWRIIQPQPDHLKPIAQAPEPHYLMLFEWKSWKKTLWLSLIFHGVQAYSSQIPSLPHLEILSRTRSSAALMAVQRSLPSQSQLGGFRSAMVNQLQGLGSLGFQPCK